MSPDSPTCVEGTALQPLPGAWLTTRTAVYYFSSQGHRGSVGTAEELLAVTSSWVGTRGPLTKSALVHGVRGRHPYPPPQPGPEDLDLNRWETLTKISYTKNATHVTPNRY